MNDKLSPTAKIVTPYELSVKRARDALRTACNSRGISEELLRSNDRSSAVSAARKAAILAISQTNPHWTSTQIAPFMGLSVSHVVTVRREAGYGKP